MGGPIEDLMIPFMKYLPLMASGFFLTRAIMRESRFYASCSGSKFLRPILLMINASGLILYSIIPCLLCFVVSTISCGDTKVPLFTFGISPFGPRILACFLSYETNSGVHMILSNGTSPLAISMKVSSVPILSTPTSFSY